MNPHNRQKTLLFIAATAAGIWLGDRLVLTPLIQSWKARTAKIADLRKRVSQGSVLVERDAVIRRRWSGMKTNALPRETSTAESRVLKAFDNWSQQSRVSITSIKPQWRRTSDDYATLECRVDAAGTLATVTRFLHSVETDPLALKIDIVELSARDNDGQQLGLGLQVSGLQLNPDQQP
jgi:hypothetical protein